MKVVENLKIKRYKEDSSEEVEVSLIKEVPLTIFLNGKEVVTLLCLGDYMKELALGFLGSEGFINNFSDIKSVRMDEEKGVAEVETTAENPLVEGLFERRTITSGCGKGSTFYNVMDAFKCKKIESNIKVKAAYLLDLMKKLHEFSGLYRETHGVHNAALADVDGIIIFREDIGRHNAVDKINGYSLLNRVGLSDKIIITTARVSSEILIKAGKMGIPVILSRSVPTALAVSIAGEIGITIAGFARGGSLSIYSHGERVED
ncbi:MAG: formate dehydrogenase accessory sulfurtransferase FdhD [Deltaproteobacteria bacterium]